MRKVAFIGGYDKTDLIIYIAKILTVLGQKVLVVDTTITSKTKYIVPTLTPTKKYVTTFDNVDVAIGFESLQEFKDYQSIDQTIDPEYDFVFCDIDSPEAYRNFEFCKNDLHFFVTTFDVYSVQKGVSVIKAFTEPTNCVKVIFTKDPESEESEYIDFITMNCKVRWDNNIIYFPFETNDLYAIYLNQRYSKVKFFNLGFEYMDCLMFMAELISGRSNGEIKKAVRLIDKE